MPILRICKNCNKEFKPYIYIHEKRIPLYRRKYCFECSPYESIGKNRFISKTRNTLDGKRQCLTCMEFKDLEEFSPTNKRGNLNSYCKSCAARKRKTTTQKFKEQCAEYKGGKCEKCGYNKCIAALEFHHRDPREKEFQVSYKNHKRFDEVIKAELDKCDCLCSNCHKETHYLLENKL